MYGSTADIQSATADIRRIKKEERKKKPQDKNIMSASVMRGGDNEKCIEAAHTDTRDSHQEKCQCRANKHDCRQQQCLLIGTVLDTCPQSGTAGKQQFCLISIELKSASGHPVSGQGLGCNAEAG